MEVLNCIIFSRDQDHSIASSIALSATCDGKMSYFPRAIPNSHHQSAKGVGHPLNGADLFVGNEFARVHLPKVILTDINLSRVNGADAMEIMHAKPRTAHIAIISLSPPTISSRRGCGQRASFLDYATKSVKVVPSMEEFEVTLIYAQKTDPQDAILDYAP